MKFPTMFLSLTLLFLAACGDSDAPEVNPAPVGITAEAPTTFAPAAAPEKPSAFATEQAVLDNIKTIYANMQRQVAAGTMTRDSFAYTCEEVHAEGQIKILTGNDGLKLAIHTYGQGDHFGATEEYYFVKDELVFLYVDSGSWRFGGEMEVDEEGNEYPGTVDEITEERRYFNADTLVKALTKSYQLNSWEDNTGKADRTPNTVEQDPQRPTAALDLIRSVMATRSVNCEQVRYMN